MTDMKVGQQVEFRPKSGKPRKGTIEKVSSSRGLAKVVLEGDPFAVTVQLDQLSSCAANGNNVRSTKVRKARTTEDNDQGESKPMSTTRTSAKDMRKQAQSLGIKGWEDMGRTELANAIKEAEAGESAAKPTTRKRRTSSKSKPAATKRTRKAPATKKAPAKRKSTTKAAPKRKAPAKKTAPAKSKAKPASPAKSKPTPKKDEPAYTDPPSSAGTPEEGNPFRKGSNLHLIFPILVPRGGKRRTLAERLAKKVDLHPYSGKDEEVDILDFDKRLLLAAQTLRDKHGYAIERKGRGIDGTIKVFIPGSEHDPRSKTTTRKKATRKKS